MRHSTSRPSDRPCPQDLPPGATPSIPLLKPEEIPVIILAGGYGARLHPLTKHCPKSMLPVGGRPALDHIVGRLKRQGFRHVTLALHYMAEMVLRRFPSDRYDGMTLQHHVAPTDCGTAGSVREAGRQSEGPYVLVVCGDVLTSFDLLRLVVFHYLRQSAFTIGLVRVPDARDFGLAHCDRNHRVVAYCEKPESSPTACAWVNAGIYLIGRETLDLVPEGATCDLGRDIIPGLLDGGIPIFGNRQFCPWFDIGVPERLKAANSYYAPPSRLSDIETLWGAKGETSIAP